MQYSKIELKQSGKVPSSDIIVGAGPVGLALALALHRLGRRNIVVYEGRPNIPNMIEESYSLGINPRTQHLLELIDPKLLQKVLEKSLPMTSMTIRAGKFVVKQFNVGTLYGTTRGTICSALFQATQGLKQITINFNHKLSGIDFLQKTLKFKNGDKEVLVEAANARVFGCDGDRSNVRRELERHDQTFKCQTFPWQMCHRCIYGTPGKSPSGLDQSIHYICGGLYVCCLINENGVKQWSAVTAARDNADDYGLLTSENASEQNVALLKKLVAQKCGELADFFSQQEYQKYFTRKVYRGQVVRCSRLNFEEWLLLLGDSAHAVLPPTGEGINSGMEDVESFIEAEKKGESFSKFNQNRYKDVNKLGEYAQYLNDNPFILEKVSRGIFFVANSMFSDSEANLLFGKKSDERIHYGQIFDKWSFRKAVILNMSRAVVYPVGGVVMLASSPIWLPFYLYNRFSKKTVPSQ